MPGNRRGIDAVFSTEPGDEPYSRIELQRGQILLLEIAPELDQSMPLGVVARVRLPLESERPPLKDAYAPAGRRGDEP